MWRDRLWAGLTLLLVSSILPCYGPRSIAGETDSEPNIVLIVADDIGWGDVGFNGRKEWSTPNLDRLAKEGRVLARCYTAAVVCAPSRASFLTGKATIHSGVRANDVDLPAEEVTIAEALKPLGYRTGLFGKWHSGRPRTGQIEPVHPIDQGFDEFFGYRSAEHAWEKFPTKLWEGQREVSVSGYIDDLITDRGVDFVRRNSGRPYFLYLAFVATHFHVAAPQDEIALHKGKFEEVDAEMPLKATYAAMVTRLDRNIGRLLETIRQLDRSRDTLIVFTSDHGATFESGNGGTSAALDSNRPFRGQKRTLWEGGVRVPGLAWWPGRIPAETTGEEIVQLIDLLPTFVAAASGRVEPAWHVDGINLLDVWRGKAIAPDRTIFWEWQSERADQIAVMRGKFKLVATAGGKSELYDVVGDPAERRDISAEHPELTKELRDELTAWLKTEIHR